MATTNETPMCLMCLETPAILEDGTYQHSYCEPCLAKHCETQQQESEVLPCPGCPNKSETTDGDHADTVTGSVVDKDGEGLIGSVKSAKTVDEEKVAGAVENKCKICHLKGKTQKAVNVCAECSDLQICEACTLNHGKNKLTRNHVVFLIASQQRIKEANCCVEHGEPIRGNCCDCSKFVCHVCIFVEHEDHNIKALAEVFREKVEEADIQVANEERRLQGLRSDEAELIKSKNTADEMASVLIKNIDDHAEMCVELILKSKEQLKAQIKAEFHVVELLGKQLDVMALMMKESEEAIAKAKTALCEAEICTKFLEELDQASIEQEMEKLKIGDPEFTRNIESNRNAFKSLLQKSLTFHPKVMKPEIGALKKPHPYQLRMICIKNGYCMCEVCGEAIRKADASRKSECRVSCVCQRCGDRVPKPDASRKSECRFSCVCQRCGDQCVPKPDASRKSECSVSCVCQRCGDTIIKPNIRRKRECNDLTLCECQRCGWKFDLDMLTKRKGKCKGAKK